MARLREGLTPTTMETASGIFIDIADPRPEQISLHDIAWALSRQGRYGGHTTTAQGYSVAQHSVQVSLFVEKALNGGLHRADFEMRRGIKVPEMAESEKKVYAAFALMHDFAEAYMSDLPNPVKMLPGIRKVYEYYEDQFNRVIHERLSKDFGFEALNSVSARILAESLTQWADVYALRIEAYHLMPSRGREWGCDDGKMPADLASFEPPMQSLDAYHALLARLQALSG